MEDEGLNAILFKAGIDHALEEVKKVLENNRNPLPPSEVAHSYDDKYVLVESTINTFLSSLVNCLQPLGLQQEHLAQLRSWAAAGKSVQLSLEATEECIFLRKEKRKEESAQQQVTTIETSILPKMEFSSKTVKTITEWFWSFSAEYKLHCFSGSSVAPDDSIVLTSRKCERELMTRSEDAPWPKVHQFGPLQVPLTWAMKHLSDGFVWEFAIDRAAKSCHTPSRNANSLAARQFLSAVRRWAEGAGKYFGVRLRALQEGNVAAKALCGSSLFSPVMPLFEEPAGDARSGEEAPSPSGLSKLPASFSCEPSAMLPVVDIERLLHRQRETIDELNSVLGGLLTPTGFFTIAEGMAASIFRHIAYLAKSSEMAIHCVETMITQQLIAAIGKVLSPTDFANYMLFHNRKLFKEEFLPLPFSHSIRRPDRSPEGVLSIECSLADGSTPEPLHTISRQSASTAAMRFPIGAATEVSFLGDRYVHAWVGHQFSGSSGMSVYLEARARQFSSFILLIGNIAGASVFQPKYGIIIQNKDDLKVPLLLEQIPTPKEFRDAIESLSPEQQRFAKAFRAMQLESTLFGIAVIQIKPLLEKLLRLPEDSLTKEIRLVEDLQELFIKYQIPSDILSYDGPAKASVKEKVLSVRSNADAVIKMVDDLRQTEIRLMEEKREAEELERRLREELMRKRKEEAEKARRAEVERQRVEQQRYQEERRRAQEERMKECEEKTETLGRTKGGGGSRFRGLFSRSKAGAPRAATASYESAPKMATETRTEFPDVSVSHSRLAAEITAPLQKTASKASAVPKPARAVNKSRAPKRPTVVQPAAQPTPEAAHAEAALAEPISSEQEPSPAQRDAMVPEEDGSEQVEVVGEDYTKIPARLDAKYELLDEDNCLRPTIIKASNQWTMRSQASLLSTPVERTIVAAAQKEEKNRAFDLLDALTKSGSVVIDRADLHVVIAATHCFDKALLETVVQDNMNPIEKVERSTLIIATTIHDRAAADLIKPSRLEACRATSPALF